MGIVSLHNPCGDFCHNCVNHFHLYTGGNISNTVFYNLLNLLNTKKETMKIATHTTLLLITVFVLTSCGTVKQNALHTKKARWVPGNAKHFQQRADAKAKRDSLKLITVKHNK